VEIEKTVDDDVVEPGQTIFYELTVSNIGGLPLEGIAIDDIFPPTIFYVSYEIVGDGLPIVCGDVPTATTPDYFGCEVDGVLQAGEELPTIRVTALVGDDAQQGDQFDNQSRVIADFVKATSGPVGFRQASAPAIHGFGSGLRLPSAIGVPPPDGNLSCSPVEGQVCNVSPVVLATGQVDPTTSTTVPAPITTLVSPNLPATGSSNNNMLIAVSVLLLAAGSTVLVVGRRCIG
jgi:uncharacterized repeat protein (TIGR01451 family)/LPXTG-motif cell wall-anchored protein